MIGNVKNYQILFIFDIISFTKKFSFRNNLNYPNLLEDFSSENIIEIIFQSEI